MQIVIDGNTLKAARITGPQHHFLKIGFCETPQKIVFFDCFDGSKNKVTNKHELLLQTVIDDLQCIKVTQMIASVAYDRRDTPNKTAYRELLIEMLNNCPIKQ